MNHALHALRTLFSRKAILSRGRTRDAIYTRLAGGERLERRAMLAADVLSPWHNAALPMDVNGDQNITPLDAVTVITQLNAGRGGVLTSASPISRANFMAAAGDSRPSYVDVNNDGALTPLDAVLVVNRLNAAADERVRIRVDVTDLSGNPINTETLSVGETFQVRGFVQDLREPSATESRGVASAFLDVNYNPALVDATGPITYGADYPQNHRADSFILDSEAGVLNEIGGFNSTSNLDTTERLLFTVQFVVLAGGPITFTPNMPEEVGSEIILWEDPPAPLPEIDVLFVSDTVTLGTPPTATDDTLAANEDAATDLDVLVNDDPHPEGEGPLTIVAFNGVTPGATVQIINGGTAIRYTSVPNAFGTDTFTYTVRDANNEEDTATVTVNVANVNDPPDADDDVFTIDANAPQQVLDVLVNDDNLPDPPGEALTIFGLTPLSPAGSGTVVLLNNDTRIGFTPTTGFVGDVTFTYRVRDPGGAESEPATVVIHVRNDNPTAGADTGTVPEGSTENAIDVLANDYARRRREWSPDGD